MIQIWNSQQNDFTKRKNIVLPEGGKEPIERICAAYGFTSRLSLCRHLGVSQSTMANRVSRGNFPADWVLICAMETGASLEWLVFGNGSAGIAVNQNEKLSTEKDSPTPTQLSYSIIQNGVIQKQNPVFIASELIPTDSISPHLVASDGLTWIVDDFSGELVDGFWLIEMDGVTSVREVHRLPGGRIHVENGKYSFDCQAEDIKVIGKAISRTEYL